MMPGSQNDQLRKWTHFPGGPLVLAFACSLAMNVACAPPCQSISYRTIDLRCDPLVGFSGELHLDSRASFDTFLRTQCLLPDDEMRIENALEAVDFSREAIFVVVRPMNAANGNCLLERDVEEVEICDDGLNVIFTDDYYADPGACPNGNWTIAFALSRDDMRTALRVAGDD